MVFLNVGYSLHVLLNCMSDLHLTFYHKICTFTRLYKRNN